MIREGAAGLTARAVDRRQVGQVDQHGRLPAGRPFAGCGSCCFFHQDGASTDVQALAIATLRKKRTTRCWSQRKGNSTQGTRASAGPASDSLPKHADYVFYTGHAEWRSLLFATTAQTT